MPALEIRDDQVVLGREMPVERHLGHARLGDDPVDPGTAIAIAVEQACCGIEDAVARGWGGHDGDRERRWRG
jgi:hypothetical protein